MISCRSFKNGRHVTCQINSNVPGIQTVLHKRGNTGHLPYSSYAAAPWFLRIIGGHNFRINLIAISLETSDFLYEKGTCCICSTNRYFFLTKKVANLFLTEHLGGVLSLWLFESPELYWLFYRFFENEELLSQPSNKNCIWKRGRTERKFRRERSQPQIYPKPQFAGHHNLVSLYL